MEVDRNLSKAEIKRWCNILGVSCKDLISMTDEEFEEELRLAQNRILNGASQAKSAKWCEEFAVSEGRHEGYTFMSLVKGGIMLLPLILKLIKFINYVRHCL